MAKTARGRLCDIHRLTVLGASLLITLSGLAIKTYYTAMATADSMSEIRADVKTLLRNDAAQTQRERDAEQDRDRIRQRVEQLEDRGWKHDRR